VGADRDPTDLSPVFQSVAIVALALRKGLKLGDGFYLCMRILRA
jgi:hypothetical protein